MIRAHLTLPFTDYENDYADVIDYLIPPDQPFEPYRNGIIVLNNHDSFFTGGYVNWETLHGFEMKIHVFNFADVVEDRDHTNVLKHALCLMYSQNPDAFEEMLEIYSHFEQVLLVCHGFRDEQIVRQFYPFYDDIIDFVYSQSHSGLK
jgi:hypothetical protein